MSDQNQLLQNLQQQLAAAQSGNTVGWNQNASPAGLVGGVLVPVKFQTPDGGSIRSYLQLPAECGQSPQAFFTAVQNLISQGYPVDIYQPNNNGGNWSGGGNSGGWNNNGGSYRGGYRNNGYRRY